MIGMTRMKMMIQPMMLMPPTPDSCSIADVAESSAGSRRPPGRGGNALLARGGQARICQMAVVIVTPTG
jgi:hypothetical protein